MNFLDKLEAGFISVGIPCSEFFSPEHVICFGISGGADSMALLRGSYLLREKYFPKNGADFVVVTVNHNIRSPKESLHDVDFVVKYTEKLSRVKCTVITLERGMVKACADERGRGVEEAARFLRYQAFERVAEEIQADFFCLAHNQNDQIETLLLNFLQGNTSGGIPKRRSIFYRPLLNITRPEIESFLEQEKISFCTDKTNFDSAYLRNRCRNQLIPVLTDLFPGWEKAVLKGADKLQDDREFIQNHVGMLEWKELSTGVWGIDVSDYLALPAALRRRFLYMGLEIFQLKNRLPYALLEETVHLEKKSYKDIVLFFTKEIYGAIRGNYLTLSVKSEQKLEHVSMVFTEPGTFYVKNFLISIQPFVHADEERCPKEQNITSKNILNDDNSFFVSLPCVFRSPLPGDIICKSDKKRSLASEIPLKGRNKSFIIDCFKDHVQVFAPNSDDLDVSMYKDTCDYTDGEGVWLLTIKTSVNL